MAVLGVAALVLVLVGAGCRNPFRKKPEEVLAHAQNRWTEGSGVRLHARLALDVDTPGTETTPHRSHITLTIDSAGSGKTPEEIRGEGTLTAELSAEDFDGKFAFAQRAIGQTAYLQLQDLTVTMKGGDARVPRTQLQIDSALGAVKGMIGGKWIKIDPQEIASLVKEFGGTKIAIPTPEELHTRQEQIRVALRAHPILLVREDLGNDRVGNVSAYRYRVGINRDAIGSLVTTLSAQLGVPSTQAEEAQHALQDPEVMARIDGVAGEAWISKNEQDILKFAFPIDLAERNGMKASGSAVVEFSDWGKPVTVEAPADAKTIQELFGPLLGGMFGGGLRSDFTPGASPGTPDGTDAPAGALAFPPNVGGPIDTSQVHFKIGTGPDSDGDGLSDSEEARYGSDPHQADTDHDGFLDGVEVQRGYSPTGPGRLPRARR